MYKKPYPLYHKQTTSENGQNKVTLIRICQDCGYIETQHGPSQGGKWKHLFMHPDYFQIDVPPK